MCPGVQFHTFSYSAQIKSARPATTWYMTEPARFADPWGPTHHRRPKCVCAGHTPVTFLTKCVCALYTPVQLEAICVTGFWGLNFGPLRLNFGPLRLNFGPTVKKVFWRCVCGLYTHLSDWRPKCVCALHTSVRLTEKCVRRKNVLFLVNHMQFEVHKYIRHVIRISFGVHEYVCFWGRTLICTTQIYFRSVSRWTCGAFCGCDIWMHMSRVYAQTCQCSCIAWTVLFIWVNWHRGVAASVL